MSTQVIDKDVFELLPERKAFDLKQKLSEIVAFAQELKVDNETNFRKITAMYAESREWEKLIEFARKQANGPDQDRINARNDKAKEIIGPLRQIQAFAKEKSAKYQEMLEAAKKEEEERIKAAVELLELEGVPYIPPVEQIQRGDGAMCYTRLVKRFKLVDLSKVPLKYLKLDEDAIELDIKLGVLEIPGISIYEEKTTTLRTR